VSGPDVQCDLDPRRLFAPHNNLTELLTFFGFQLRYAEMNLRNTGTRKRSDGLTGIYQRLESDRVDKFLELGEGRTVSLAR
jgi:hypothetical protein